MKPKNVTTKVVMAPNEKKTTQMFLQALKLAEQGNVLYLSKEVINELPKDLNLTIPPEKTILKRIIFTYPLNSKELLSKCCSIHTWKNVPRAIIVNGLDEYCDFDPEALVSNSALLCAGLLHAASSCTATTNEKCHLVVSFNSESYNKHKNSINILVHTYLYGDVSVID